MIMSASVNGLGKDAAALGQGEVAAIVEDPTVCFVNDKILRACPACDTVFKSSAWAMFAAGQGAGCPFCHAQGTAPALEC